MGDVRLALHALQGPDGTPDHGDRSTAALMFTDIVDSTALIGVIGDEAWEQLLRWHHRTFRSLFAGSGGREVENTGDGFFAAFDDAHSAVECAIEIQRTLANQRTQQGFAPQVRIGLHLGEVTEVAATLAGEQVHKAARIAGQAGGGEILASLELMRTLDGAVGSGEPLTVALKGFADEVEVVHVAWD